MKNSFKDTLIDLGVGTYAADKPFSFIPWWLLPENFRHIEGSSPLAVLLRVYYILITVITAIILLCLATLLLAVSAVLLPITILLMPIVWLFTGKGFI